MSLDAERKEIARRLDVMSPVSQLSVVLGLVHAAAKDLVGEVAKQEKKRPTSPGIMRAMNNLTQLLLLSGSVAHRVADIPEVRNTMEADKAKLL